MLNVKTNAKTEKGALRPAVRTAIKEAIEKVTISLSNGSVVELEYKGNGTYFGPIAVCEDETTVNAKVEMVITINDYKEPIKKALVVKESEAIEVE